MPPAHCLLAAGKAPGRPVGRCSRFPRAHFPGSALSCTAPYAGPPSRTRPRRSQTSVPSKVVDTSSPAVFGLDFRRGCCSLAAASRGWSGGITSRRRKKTKTNTRWTVVQKCTLQIQPGSKAPLGPLSAHGPLVRTWLALTFEASATTLDNVSLKRRS